MNDVITYFKNSNRQRYSKDEILRILESQVLKHAAYYRHKVSGKQYLVEENGLVYWQNADDKWVHSLLTFNQLKEHFEPLTGTRWFKGFCGGNITLIWKFEDGVLWFWCPTTSKFRSSDFKSLDNLISQVSNVQETDYNSVKQYLEPKVRWFKGKGRVTDIIYVWKIDHTDSLWFYDNGRFVRSSHGTIEELKDCNDSVQETDYDSIKGIIKGCE